MLFQSVDSPGSGDANPSTSPRNTPSRGFSMSKRMPALSLSRSKQSGRAVSVASVTSSKSGSSGDKGGGVMIKEDPTVLGVDQFPGGDAMLEVLTRLQSLQERFSVQLQVRVEKS